MVKVGKLVEMAERRKIGVLSVQETRWKRNIVKELGGYKLFCSLKSK